MVKIVLIGAGSHCFGRGQIADIINSKELDAIGIRLVLVDVDAAALELMRRFAETMKAKRGSKIIIEAFTDRRQALPEADYVVVAVAQKRWQLWEQDFRVPNAFGFRQILGENGGPGALFHAMRSIHLIIPIAKDMETLCPNALLLNFTNPEARVLNALLNLTRIKSMGICHGYFSAENYIAKLLEVPTSQIHITSAGMNHFYCVLNVLDKENGKDRFEEVLGKAASDLSAPPLFRKMAQIFGVLTFPSDDHFGEYLPFGCEYSDGRWHYGNEFKPFHIQPEAPAINMIQDYLEGNASLENSLFSKSGEITVSIISDIETNSGAWRPAVNVMNSGSFREKLPKDAVVEIPAHVDAKGAHPECVGPIPETFANFMRTHFTIHRLCTEAYRTRSRKLLLQALLLDPCVNDIAKAEKLLDTMLNLQKEFLPSFG
ncbi:MAG: hypothetical protein A2X49_15210 [Lentisphaerae bacterium GWF2_52_8]|nr:MAG: hypothetical protein A2X49_15210 [Lentisphaerae bacterium GWF2_52_8]